MAERNNRTRASEDVSQRIQGERTDNRVQPTATAKAAEGKLKAGRGEPGAAGSPASKRIEAQQEREAKTRGR